MPPIPSPFAVFRTISRRTYPISRAAVRPYARPFVRYQHSIPPIHTPNSSQQQSPEQPIPSQQETEISALGRHSHIPRAKPQGEEQSTEARKPYPPSYELTFTCTPCSTRSTHSISKHGYHFGSVLVTCPECRNRHVISDHLNIFGDRNLTIEDLMREQGQLIKKGTLSEDGDLEFWSDGSMNKRGQMHGKRYENREDDGAVRGESFNPGKAK